MSPTLSTAHRPCRFTPTCVLSLRPQAAYGTLLTRARHAHTRRTLHARAAANWKDDTARPHAARGAPVVELPPPSPPPAARTRRAGTPNAGATPATGNWGGGEVCREREGTSLRDVSVDCPVGRSIGIEVGRDKRRMRSDEEMLGVNKLGVERMLVKWLELLVPASGHLRDGMMRGEVAGT